MKKEKATGAAAVAEGRILGDNEKRLLGDGARTRATAGEERRLLENGGYWMALLEKKDSGAKTWAEQAAWRFMEKEIKGDGGRALREAFGGTGRAGIEGGDVAAGKGGERGQQRERERGRQVDTRDSSS